jgi:hypothetical protein
MDRKKLVDLFQRGMQYPAGTHRFWISRCFEITVGTDDRVQLDEYESFCAEKNSTTRTSKEMFHVGRSVVNLKDGQVLEERGAGWEKKSEK